MRRIPEAAPDVTYLKSTNFQFGREEKRKGREGRFWFGVVFQC